MTDRRGETAEYVPAWDILGQSTCRGMGYIGICRSQGLGLLKISHVIVCNFQDISLAGWQICALYS